MSGIDALMPALPWLLATGVALASLRLLLGVRRLPADARPSRWRTGALLLGQCASAMLLFLLLRTAQPGDDMHTLHLLTAHAPATVATVPKPGESWLRLPEAASRDGIEPVPDLATALRRHPRLRTLHIVGDGLEARDRDDAAASRLAIRFERAPLAPGIRDWWAPHSLRSGDAVHVRGSAQGGARIELLDPAGIRTDLQVVQDDAAFSLQAPSRSPGLAVYQLRLLDGSGKPIETTPIPIQVMQAAPTRLLLRSGGPDPELKFLRRWAADNGASLQATIDLGGGMQAGDAPVALEPRTLAEVDVLILDDRSWNGLGQASRMRVLDAVGAGMGLLLRATAPLADGDALGIRVRNAQLPASFSLPAADAGSASHIRLTRSRLQIDNPGGTSVLRDDRGQPLAGWRAHGRGRIGVWLPIDSYRLVLAGHADAHARLWADAVDAVARARLPATRVVPARIYRDERSVLCGLGDSARILQPGDAAPLRLAVDPRSGDRRCAAFWPTAAGWHRLLDSTGTDTQNGTALLVLPDDADRALRAARTQQATAALAEALRAAPAPAWADSATSAPRWLLFLLWLATTAALWWLERSRTGRTRAPTPG